MFSIRIDMPEVQLTGVIALDKRRSLKLPDDSALFTKDSVMMKLSVDEGFARAHFHPADRHESRGVKFEHLQPSDVEVDAHNYVTFRKDLPPERIKELWLGGEKLWLGGENVQAD
jgi:hypothetical protein